MWVCLLYLIGLPLFSKSRGTLYVEVEDLKWTSRGCTLLANSRHRLDPYRIT